MNGGTEGPLPATDGPGESRPRSGSWGRRLVWGLLTAFLVLIGIGLYRALAGQLAHGPAPDFTLALFDGGTFRLADLFLQNSHREAFHLWRNKRDELARIPRSGSDWAAAAKMGGRKPSAASDSPATL